MSSLQLELRGLFGAEGLEVESLIHKVASSFYIKQDKSISWEWKGRKRVSREDRLLRARMLSVFMDFSGAQTDHVIFLEQCLAPWKDSHMCRFHQACTCAGESEEGQKGARSWEWPQVDVLNSLMVVSKLDAWASRLDEVEIMFKLTRANVLGGWEVTGVYEMWLSLRIHRKVVLAF